jgi:hypothetical protein
MSKFKRVAWDDPKRCQGTAKNGQCPYESVGDTGFCMMHAQAGRLKLAEQKAIRNFQLSQWQARVNKFADNDQIKSLREEIGIIRLLLENLMLLCRDENDLLLNTGKIADLVTRLEKLVGTCHRLELQNSELLSRSDLILLAQQIVNKISEHITDDQIMEKLGLEIVSIALKKSNETELSTTIS